MPVSQERLRRALATEIYALLGNFFDADVAEPIVVSAATDRHKIAIKLSTRGPKSVSVPVVSGMSPDMSGQEADTLKAKKLAERSSLRQALGTEVDMLLNNLFDADVDEPIVVSASDDRHKLVLKLLTRRPNSVSLSVMSHLSPDMSGMSPDMSGEKVHLAPDKPDILSPMQRDILRAFSGNAMRARQLAERAGYRLNSHFRGTLSRLVSRGYLERTLAGYVQTSNQSAGNLDRSA
jgi:hypothetical protein